MTPATHGACETGSFEAADIVNHFTREVGKFETSSSLTRVAYVFFCG